MEMRNCLKDMIPYTAGKTIPKAVKLSSNENPLGPSPMAVEALGKALNRINRYPDGVSFSLRKKLADKFNLSENQIIIGNGSDEILAFLAGAYINPGDNGITALNTFSEYSFSIKLFDGIVKKIPLKNGRFDLEGIRESVNGRTKIIFLCSPNNPTGTCISRTELTGFLDSVPKSVLTIVDEAYSDFAEAPDYPDTISMLSRYPNLFITRTFSKLYGLAGLRVGYGMGNEEVVNALFRTKQAFNINLPAQIAAEAALDDAEFVKKTLNFVRNGKKQLYAGLDRLSVEYYPTEANFICMNLNRDSEELYRLICDRGIAVRPCKSFGLETWIRYTIGTEENNRLFLSILEDIPEIGKGT